MILEERILHKKYIVLLLLILISLLSINAISAEEIENNNNLITTSGVNSLGTSNIQSTGLENNEDNDVTIDENDNNYDINDLDDNSNVLDDDSGDSGEIVGDDANGDGENNSNETGNVTEEDMDITYDFDATEDFETLILEYNSVIQNGTTTINMILSDYDSININYDNQDRILIINGNDTTVISDFNLNIGENSTVIINSITFNGTVSIVNNGTLYLMNDSFINNVFSTYLIDNNNNLFINDSLFMDINSSLLNNKNIASINNSQIISINSALSGSSLITNQGKLMIDSTVLSDNVMNNLINDPNDYDFVYEDTEFYKVAEVLIINSKLNNSIHYINPYIQAKQITILNTSFNNLKLEDADNSSTILAADEIIMLDTNLSEINISVESETFSSVNNYDENGVWSETTDMDEEELIVQTNEYVDNFLDTDVIIVYKPQLIETQVTIDEMNEAIYGENITIQGQLTDVEGNIISNGSIIISSNFEGLYLSNTDDEGRYYYTFEVIKMGENTIDVKYEGDDSYKEAVNSTIFNVTKKASVISVDDISDVQYTDNVTITGRYTDTDNNYLRYTPIIITVNGVKYSNYTNSYGIFTYTLRTNKLGENNVTVAYPGNSRFKGANDSTIFNVTRKDTKFTLNVPSQVQYLDNVTITGQYTDTNGVNLRYTPIILTINDKNYTLTTNATGEFTYTFKANVIGINNVSVLYKGNMRYNGCEEKYNIEVLRKETIFTLDKISKVEYTDSVSISGIYTDIDGNNLRYTPIKLKVNNNQFIIYTDSNGQFSFLIKASQVGTNNVTVSYPGNARYAPAIEETSFEVSKKSTIFTISNISQKSYSEDVLINGTYTDINGNSLRYTPIKLIINNNVYTVTTNVYGQFSFTIKATIVGTNNITVSYPGNARYAGTSINTTFKVVPKPTNISLVLSQKQAKSNITVSGKFVDKDGLSLRYTPLTVNINGNKVKVTTDGDGNYNYSLLPTTAGTYYLTVSYGGNARYAATSTTKTFKIVKT